MNRYPDIRVEIIEILQMSVSHYVSVITIAKRTCMYTIDTWDTDEDY